MDSPLPPNPYKTLGVSKDATLPTIKSAHRKLVLTCHPDKFQDEAVKLQKSEQFHQVQQAYEILSDDERRQSYDNRVKLAELRAESMMDKGGPRTYPEYSSRPKFSPVFEVRGDRIYEERVPRNSREEDVFSANFRDHRPAPQNFDDLYHASTSRRSSGRLPEEKRKARDVEDERDWDRYDRQARKEADRKANHGNKKKSDKDKRKEREAKFTSKATYVEDDTDSDIPERYSAPRRDTPPRHSRNDSRRDRDDFSRRSGKLDDSDQLNALEAKTSNAEDYIQRSRRAGSIDPEPRRPQPGIRHVSAFESRPPAPSPVMVADPGRRSSGRARDSRRSSPVRISAKDRRMTEIVDPADRRPSIPGLSSDPRGLKNLVNPSKRESHRASTEKAMPETRHPFTLRRAETMPLQASHPPSASRRNDTHPARSSRMRSTETNDSGYSSSGAPDLYPGASPQLRTTTYKINEEDDHVIYVEPDEMSRWDRDVSPKSRRQEERPAMGGRGSSSARGPPPRSKTHAFHNEPAQPRQPPLSRRESSRNPPVQTRQSSRPNPYLYGECSSTEDYKIVNQSPRLNASDIRYSRRSPDEASRDAYPGSQFESRHLPNLSRYESSRTAAY